MRRAVSGARGCGEEVAESLFRADVRQQRWILR
jgi:hypothetical protein